MQILDTLQRKENNKFNSALIVWQRKYETAPEGFWKKKIEFEKDDETFAIWTSTCGIGEGGHYKIMLPQIN